ncbi:MAG: glycoside hydrolase family 127 protein [Cyclobacteriaceae bacterium]
MAQPVSPFEKIQPIAEKYQLLPIGEAIPGGWIREQIEENLRGFTGHLDTLAPDLILHDDIYGKNRLSKKVKSKDVGALGVAGDWQVQFLWWNSETQSNWYDGYIRSAILTNNSAHLSRAEKYVQHILATQDADGYIGIYDTDLRYRFENENGELWAKATVLRGLLAWYEYKQDPAVLMAIERAIQNVMDNYPAGQSHPFYSKNPNIGGTSHGLMITDVFESLYRLTDKQVYLDYCLFLYKDFSDQKLNEDAQYTKLVDGGLMLKGHSVHTYEHVRSLAAAYHASGNSALGNALDIFLKKIDTETTASGAGVGDEWIGGRKADATKRGYEYCSLQELMHSYLELFVKSGNPVLAERAEQIFLNPAQGARYPGGTGITYLKTDNSFYLTGGLNGDTSDPHQTRYRYSPVHKEAAVCCVPNAGRIAPYYVQYMWMKDERSLVNVFPGPGEVRTMINGKWVTVKETTGYPNDNKIALEVTATQNRFKLKIRKPAWATKISVSEKFSEEDGFIVIDNIWDGTRQVQLSFIPEVIIQRDINGETYFTYGSQVLAVPFESVEQRTKSYPITGFYDLSISPKNLVIYQYAGAPVKVDRQGKITTKLLNPATAKLESVQLVPMSKTTLRQVTFKPANVR